MMLKTHLVFALFVILLLLPYVNNKVLFLFIALFSAVLPDIDSSSSKVGRNFISRVFQIFTRHRGMLHSLTFCLALSLVLMFFIPGFSFGFFTGYGIHLLADAMTEMGILLLWPSKKFVLKGFIKTGKKFEKFLFFVFLTMNITLIIFYVMEYFGVV